MALIVEDGTGLPNAESFVSVADATAYHDARGHASWAALASDTQREQALRRATGYMEQMYRMRWAGARRDARQALSWPRYATPMLDAPGGYGTLPAYYPMDAVPVVVQQACAELALRAASADLSPDLGPQEKSTTVGPISVSYVDGARQTLKFSAVENMLLPLFGGGGMGAVRVVRA